MRVWRSRHLALPLGVVLGVFPLPVLQPRVLAAAAPPVSMDQPSLEEAALRFAGAWSRGEGEVLQSLMRREGIGLFLPGEEHSLVRPRLARAALVDFLTRLRGGDPRLVAVSFSEGDPNKGSAELHLPSGAQGAAGPVIFTVFLGFALEGGAWRVTEVRVLP